MPIEKYDPNRKTHIVDFLRKWGVVWLPTSLFSYEEIVYARACGQIYVDENNLGWIWGMAPSKKP